MAGINDGEKSQMGKGLKFPIIQRKLMGKIRPSPNGEISPNENSLYIYKRERLILLLYVLGKMGKRFRGFDLDVVLLVSYFGSELLPHVPHPEVLTFSSKRAPRRRRWATASLRQETSSPTAQQPNSPRAESWSAVRRINASIFISLRRSFFRRCSFPLFDIQRLSHSMY
jgi:hypothetical protein